jgi:RNA-directed DNA polymerase
MNNIISHLITKSGLSSFDINRIVYTAPKRYKTYFIAKRNGGKREIAQPAREVKALQYILIEDILNQLPVHPSAKAYVKYSSIRDNAVLHSGATAIMKMDFQDFFPSILASDWRKYCEKQAILSPADIKVTSNILFRIREKEKTLRLSIGAPSSPMISNILMYEFDHYVFAEASARNIIYSRYADDMTFSGQRIGMLKDMQKVVQKAIRDTLCPRLSINATKTKFVTTKNQRNVTGLVLANDGQVGIGQVRMRLLRARIHHAINNAVTKEERMSLIGYISFLNSADKTTLSKMTVKYGVDFLQKIRVVE